MVQYRTRTYFYLIQRAKYEIIEDYYLVPPRYAEIVQFNPSLLYLQNTQVRLENLNTALNMFNYFAEWDWLNPDYRQLVEEAHQFIRQKERETQQEAQLRRLAKLTLPYMVEQIRKYCPVCGFALAKPRRGLSTIEFRRTVQRCANIDSLHENIYKLIKIYRCVSLDDELTFAFTRDYEEQLNGTETTEPED
ncbi:hypothetical protein RclHR1_20240004 [Rhizophagus clarus]|uniref:Uncharacterized protein n=1 Tax=Rhizophagus clarus TaxID=94130 RepID=A0A2Z6RJL6_9GLOM|nr:hypothetical protein RclHR1_20240004 [Rhizophagus clarus]